MSNRKAPFSAYEKEFLKELISPHASILESKKTDTDFNKKKTLIWTEITQEYNSSSRCQEATSQQLKKLWLNMKARARDAKSLECQRRHTGGGPSIPDMASEHESVLAIVPHIMPTIKVSQDSDGPGDIINGDDDEMAWFPKRARLKSVSPDLLPDKFVSGVNFAPEYLPEKSAPYNDNTTRPPERLLEKSVPYNDNSTRPPECLPEKSVSSTTLRKTNNNVSSIDALKIKLIEKDIEHRNVKFQIEIENQKKINDYKYQMMLLEYEHKKKLYELIEKEQEEKVKKASQ